MTSDNLAKKGQHLSPEQLAAHGFERLREEDPQLYSMLDRENARQNDVLAMVAASSIADPSVLVCEGSAVTNVTTEGYPGARFHAGCGIVDEIENLCIERARKVFKARYANVQPHSGSSANAILMFSLLSPGDAILGLDLDSGGHLTHGSSVSFSGRYFRAAAYGLTPEGLIDYDQVRDLAHRDRPRLIICGASAYPRFIDFARFREIADEVDAYLLADISHISGLVVGGQHPSPIDHAHFTTTSTYKQLYGPRGGLIMMGRDHDAKAPDGREMLSAMIQRAVFPYFQGTPNLAAIAAKARALDNASRDEFGTLCKAIVDNARVLADLFAEMGYRVLTGGTDNHIVLLDILESRGISGVIAEKALESCNIVINKNRIAGDKKSALVTSGVRLGTNSLALRSMDTTVMPACAALIDGVLKAVVATSDIDYQLEEKTRAKAQAEIIDLCRRFPLPQYVAG